MRSADTADLLTTKEVAAICRVSTATVTRWVATGRLTGVRVGPRLLRFQPADVEALLAPETGDAA